MVTAFVRTMRYISAHSAEEIAEHLPNDYVQGDRALYVERLAESKAMFTTGGRMPEECPEMALKVLSSFSKGLRDKQIDLSRTYTTEFVDNAEERIRSPDMGRPVNIDANQ